MRYEITAKRENNTKTITHVQLDGWEIAPVASVIQRINSTVDVFFVKDGIYETLVTVVSGGLLTEGYLRTQGNLTLNDNLDNLPNF